MTASRTPNPPGPTLPVIAGRFALMKLLGKGGMCSVYQAYDVAENRMVAVKILDPELRDRRDIRRRFTAEGISIQRIDHRHVIELYDVGVHDDGAPYIAMELVEGGSLDQWIDDHGPMPPRMAAAVLMQVCKGVGAAHAEGIVHRDIKPHNVLINRRGVCRVADFGIAQDADFATMTRTGQALGTAGYMAPEQRIDAQSVDARADVYALGATLYHLLTGTMVIDLFEIERNPELLRAVHPALVPVLLNATRYDPDLRYASGAEMARALHEQRNHLPADPEGTPPLNANVPQASTLTALTFPTIPPRTGVTQHDTPSSISGRVVTPEVPKDVKSVQPLNAPVELNQDPPDLPDYIDVASIPKPEVGFEVRLDEKSRRSTQEAVGRRAAAPPKRSVPWALLALVLLAVGGFVVGGALVTQTARHVNAADSASATAHSAWIDELLLHRDIARDVDALGGDGNAIALALEGVQRSPQGPERIAAAEAAQQTLNAIARPLSEGASPNERSVKLRLTRLDAAADAARSADDRAREAREGTLANAASTLGLISAR